MELLFDPLNRLDVAAVPITLLVDELGVIRFRNPNEQQLRTFLTSAKVKANPNRSNLPDGAALQAGDRLAMNGKLDEAIDWYAERLTNRKEQARLHFRLGVVHRMRFDKHPESYPDDFRTAIKHWKKALQLNPNQYIWRRRIQQYGPILDKPYPFYNWVDQARREVLARGDNPLELRVEPAGAELIGPGQRIATDQSDKTKNPDPKGKITRVAEGLLNVRSIVVPSTNKKQKAARVHVAIEPIRESGFGWNNEGGPTTL